LLELEENHIVQPLGSSFSSTMKLNIDIPLSQEIKYGPGLMETIKFAWMQYIMIFFPLLLLTYAGIEFLFKYQVFESVIVSDLGRPRKVF
jgi:hypothetical protein